MSAVDTTTAHFRNFVPLEASQSDSMVARKGADRWRGSAYFFDQDSLWHIGGVAEWRGGALADGHRDYLSFLLRLGLAPGCYPLADYSATISTDSVHLTARSVDYDVPISYYRLDHEAANFLELDPPTEGSEDTLRGRFQLTLLADFPDPPRVYPTTRFAEGRFVVTR